MASGPAGATGDGRAAVVEARDNGVASVAGLLMLPLVPTFLLWSSALATGLLLSGLGLVVVAGCTPAFLRRVARRPPVVRASPDGLSIRAGPTIPWDEIAGVRLESVPRAGLRLQVRFHHPARHVGIFARVDWLPGGYHLSVPARGLDIEPQDLLAAIHRIRGLPRAGLPAGPNP